MNKIDLSKIDLNLLPVFEVLMRERSVSRAAQALHRTQSALSHALERLRQQLGDPLLVRQGSAMVPSPYAEQLRLQLQPVLAQMAQALTPPETFDPSTATRTFRLAMRDFLAGLFPDVLYLVQTRAPKVKLEWVQADARASMALIEGSIDVLLAPSPVQLEPGIDAQPVGALHWACFARTGHPALENWGPHAWSAWPHVQVGVDDPQRLPVGAAAQRAGLSRDVSISVPLFSAVAPVLANSDLLATLPEAVMRGQTSAWGLVQCPVPFPIEPIEHALYSARRLRADPAQQWFKEQLCEALSAFFEPGITTP